MGVSIVLDRSQFDAQLAKLKRPGAPLARALNKSIESGRTLAARMVSRDMSLKVSTVKELVKTKKATHTNLVASLFASARRVPVLDFNARGPEPSRGRGPGVRAKTPARVYPHAFIATVGRGGHRGVFQRVGPARLPIRELHGASIWQSYQNFTGEIQTRVLEQLGKNVASEIAFALSKIA